MNLRATARHLFAEAIDRCQIRPALARRVWCADGHLYVGERCLDLQAFPQIRLVALGKAALAMAEGLLGVLESQLTPAHTLRGFVVGSALPVLPDPRLRYQLGAHPALDRSSVTAANAILELLSDTTPDTLVFFLVSGGASAMVDLPLHAGVSLGDLATFHQQLVHSGLPIAAMNTLRKHLSAIKGGRLALAAPQATQITLLVSDVSPAHPDIIASGPTLPDPTTLADCQHLLDAPPLAEVPVPRAIRSLLFDPQTPETPKPGHPAFAQSSVHTLLSSDDLVQAAADAARRQGFDTTIDLTPDEWPFEDAAAYLLSRLQSLQDKNPGRPICLLSAGELAVPVTTAKPGLGGRNQHFALHCAPILAQRDRRVAVLSAGSDGIDGSSPAAGAVVDQTTLMRARSLFPEGNAVPEALAGFNSYPLLHALGDTIVTGPTGNNLRDLRILLTAP